MATTLSVFTLIVRQTAAQILDRTLSVARLVGLPVDSWRVGDPTRTLYQAQAEQIDYLDAQQTDLAKSAFLSTAVDVPDFLALRAEDVYGVVPEEASFAAPSVTFNNAGGGYFELEPGGLIVLASATSATFVNQALVTINPLTSGIVVSMVAQQAGSSGSVIANAIDTIVSPTMAGVTIASSTAALGADAQSPQGIVTQCLATLGALSPAGPFDAYEYVARNFELTGIAGVTRALASGDNATGTVDVYVAATAAGLDAPSVAAIQAALDTYAQPLCTLATAASATPQTINVTLAGIDTSEHDFLEQVLTDYFGTVDLGGVIAPDAVTSACRVALAGEGRPVSGAITATLPMLATLAVNRFPVLGLLTL